MTITKVWALVLKETLAVWRDPMTRSILFIPPILQLVLFAYAMTLEVKNIEIAVYNQDSGKDSHEIIQRFVGSPHFKAVRYLENEQQVTEVMDRQQAILVLQFQPNFSRLIRRGESAKIQALLDGRRSNSSSIVLGYVNQILEEYNKEILTQLGRPQIPSQIITRHWYNPNLEYTWYTIPALAGILAMVIALALTSLSIAREREMGTFEQLLVSPVSPGQILFGKTIPAVFLALAEGLLISILGVWMFDVPFEGSVLLLATSMLVFILAVVGIGLFISSLCKTQQQAVLGTFVYMSPGITLSGFATPAENMPVALQYLGNIVPYKHFLVTVNGLFLKDVPASVVWAHTWPNLIIAFVTLSLAVWMFRRRME